MTIQTQSLTYSVGDATMVSQFVDDPDLKSQKPGILVLPEWWGVDGYIRRRAADLAGLGYAALAVDLYGEGESTDKPDRAEALMNTVLDDMDTGTKRLEMACSILAEQPGVDSSRLAAIGYCLGGAMVLHLARIGAALKAVVSFHGVLDSFYKPQPGEVKAKILVCHGGQDEYVSDESIQTFHDEMKAAEAQYEFVSYPGVLHGFTSPEADEFAEKYGLPLAYDEGTDKKSWQAMTQLFSEVF